MRARMVFRILAAMLLSIPSIVAAQEIETGQKVRVSAPRLTNPGLPGRLVRQTPDSLWIRYGDYTRPIQFSWAELSRLEVRTPSPARNRKLKQGAIGGAIVGGIAGLMLGQSVSRECFDCLKQPMPVAVFTVPAGGVLGLLVGMAGGAIASPSKWVLVTKR